MAAATCHMTTLRVVQNLKGVTLNNQQAVRSCSRASASLGARRGAAVSRLRATGVDRWGYRSSSSAKFAVSAVVDATLSSASQADSDVPAESLSMYFLKAEGSLNENAVSKVTKALEGTEGVSPVKVYIDEGAATVEVHDLPFHTE